MGSLTVQTKGGYIVAWCLLLLAVSSSLIYFEQQRRAALAQRSLSAEIRMSIEQQAASIISRLQDCASRTAASVGGRHDRPFIIGRADTDFPHYPRISSTATGAVSIRQIACPLDDDASANPTALFTTTQIVQPPGFSEWRYENRRRTAPGQPAVQVLITADDNNPTARSSLIAIHQKANNFATGTPVQQRFVLSDPAGGNLTLSIVLERQP